MAGEEGGSWSLELLFRWIVEIIGYLGRLRPLIRSYCLAMVKGCMETAS
jgi:hypothetical protein